MPPKATASLLGASGLHFGAERRPPGSSAYCFASPRIGAAQRLQFALFWRCGGLRRPPAALRAANSCQQACPGPPAGPLSCKTRVFGRPMAAKAFKRACFALANPCVELSRQARFLKPAAMVSFVRFRDTFGRQSAAFPAMWARWWRNRSRKTPKTSSLGGFWRRYGGYRAPLRHARGNPLVDGVTFCCCIDVVSVCF